MDATLDRLLSIYRFPSGRRLHALEETERLAREDGFKELATLLAEAVEHERHTHRVSAEWRQARIDRTPRFGEEAMELDRQIDSALGAVNRALEGHEAVARGAAAQSIRDLREALFPGGVVESISLSFVEEMVEVDRILDLVEGKYKQQLADLALATWGEDLRELSEQFRAVIRERKEATLDYGDVRAARSKGQEYLLRTVALIIGRHAGVGDADVSARNRLLGPILAQDDAIGAHRRSRRTVPDIDPQTGQELPVDLDAESE